MILKPTLGPRTRFNGISHQELTKPAYERLVSLLMAYGNRLSADHAAALMALVGSMTQMAQGRLEGRWAFGLPTGMGKSKSIEAWIATLSSLQLAHPITLAVAASKIEALCQMKRNLIALGVPADMIGLIHTKLYDPAKVSAVLAGGPEADRYASEPSEGEGRPYLLITHQRVRGSNLSTFNSCNGKPRDLLIYDESLLIADSTGIPVPSLRGAVGYLQEYYGEGSKYAGLIEKLRANVLCISAALSQGASSLITLSGFDEQETKDLESLVRVPVLDPVKQLVEIGSNPIRVLPDQGGVVFYEVRVPAEITNILILDASQPIRRLVHADSTIRDAETDLPQMQRVGVPLSKLKSFERVTVRQLFAGGGRSSMTKAFSPKRAEERRTVREIVEVVKNLPDDQSALIFTYKQRSKHEPDFKGVLLRDLEVAGVDTAAEVETPYGRRPRICWLTWGMETSLNEYAHCRHVILAGVIQRSTVDVAAAYLGQKDDLRGDVTSATVSDLLRSEIGHSIYQAASRGACREVDCGVAKEMTLWFIHRDDRVKEELDKVMPGARWETWAPLHLEPTAGIIAALSRRIGDHLRGLPPDSKIVSSRALKQALKVSAPPETWRLALHRCLEDPSRGWQLQGRSAARI